MQEIGAQKTSLDSALMTHRFSVCIDFRFVSKSLKQEKKKQKNMDHLFGAMLTSHVHFVHCIRPNMHGAHDIDKEYIGQQLLNSG